MDSSRSPSEVEPLAEAGGGAELPGTSGTAWTADEQLALEELMSRFPADRHPATQRYVLIASGLTNKTARDVALRARWMALQAEAAAALGGVGPRPTAGSTKRRPGEDKKQAPLKSPAKAGPRAFAAGAALPAGSRPGSSGNLVGLGLTSATGPPPMRSTSGQLRHGLGAMHLSVKPEPGPSHSSGEARTDTTGGAGGGSDGCAAGGTQGANGSGSSAATQPAELYGGTGAAGMGRGGGRFGAASPPPLPPLPPPIQLPMPGTIPTSEAAELLATLLEHNSALLAHIRANMSDCKVVENLDLLTRYRDNMSAAFSFMMTMQGVMQQMPPLPVHPNWELAARVLPPSRVPMLGMPGPALMGLPGVMAPPQPMMPPAALMLGPSMPMVPPAAMMPPQQFMFGPHPGTFPWPQPGMPGGPFGMPGPMPGQPAPSGTAVAQGGVPPGAPGPLGGGPAPGFPSPYFNHPAGLGFVHGGMGGMPGVGLGMPSFAGMGGQALMGPPSGDAPTGATASPAPPQQQLKAA